MRKIAATFLPVKKHLAAVPPVRSVLSGFDTENSSTVAALAGASCVSSVGHRIAPSRARLLGLQTSKETDRVAGYSASPELIAALGSDPARRFGSDFLVKLNASGRDYLFTKALNDRVSAMAMNQKGEIYLTGFTLDRASRGPGVQPQNRLRRLFRTKASVLALRSSKAGSEYEHFRNARKSVSIRSRSGGRGCGEAIRGGLHG